MQNTQHESNSDIPAIISNKNESVVAAVKFNSGWRYEWRCVNFSRFLYDRVQDIYIPEQVCKDLLQTA